MAEMFPWCYNWNGIWATWPNCSPVLQTEFYLGQMAEMLSLCYQRKGIETTRQGSTARVLKKTWFLSKGTNINTGWNIHITFCILHICCKQVPVTLKLSRRVLEVLKSNIYFATFLKQSRNKPGYLDSRKKKKHCLLSKTLSGQAAIDESQMEGKARGSFNLIALYIGSLFPSATGSSQCSRTRDGARI